jgi:molecular chaperone DnaK
MAFLGIDLGTTFSAVAYLDARGVPVTIPAAEGELTTPSVVEQGSSRPEA